MTQNELEHYTVRVNCHDIHPTKEEIISDYEQLSKEDAKIILECINEFYGNRLNISIV